MITRTPAGKKAYEILEWVYQDPATRVGEGRQRLAAVAGDAPSDNDVTDVGTMLSRLAGTYQDQARTITDQVR